MSHCPYELLSDLEDVLAELRTWEHVVERSPGVFYVKRLPFLHFHVNAAGDRCADSRSGKDWGSRLDVARPAPAAARRAFLAELRRRHAETLAAVAPKSRR